MKSVSMHNPITGNKAAVPQINVKGMVARGYVLGDGKRKEPSKKAAKNKGDK